MRHPARLYGSLQGVAIAVDSIRANTVRATLTILSVAVGVFAVVIMSAAVHGIDASMARDFAAAGPASFHVYRWPIGFDVCDGSGKRCPWRRSARLTLAEAAAIGRLPIIRGVAAHRGWFASVRYGDRALAEAGVDCYTPSWIDVDGGEIYPGRSFTWAENANAARVVIIDDQIAAQLFGEADPLGQEIELNGTPFRVIGVHHSAARSRRSTGDAASGSAPKAIVPLETARRDLKVSMRWLDFTVKPRADVAQADAMDAVTAVLRGMRGLQPGVEDDFAVVSSSRLLEVYDGFLGGIGGVMVSLAAVGLLVGGIGVVAIMMISVTERTREIGLRKALGATRAIILWQFLVEAATLACLGAVTGLVVGGGAAVVIKSTTPIPATIPPQAILAALLAATLTGLVFGTFPALRAARLDPVDALRYR